MKHILITIAAVLLAGCGESQQSAPSKEVKPAEPIAEAKKPEPPKAIVPDISFHSAAHGDIKAIKQHIAAGTDVNAKDKEGDTPLHVAAMYNNKEIAELLIAKGADMEAKSKLGHTPLHVAAMLGKKETTELLINNGADLNAKLDSGNTPLDFAINFKHSEIADLLRKHGAKTAEELKAEEK